MNQLVNLFANLNLGPVAAVPAGQNYHSLLFHETLDAATQNDAVLICTVVDRIVNTALGDYGSVNLGVGGAIYFRIRADLTAVFNRTYAFPQGCHAFIFIE